MLAPSHLAIDPYTQGPVVDQLMRCSDPSYFAAGNLLRGIETAGQCFREGAAAAAHIIASLRGGQPPAGTLVPVEALAPLSYVYPQRIDPNQSTDQAVMFKARVMQASRGRLQVHVNGQTVWSQSIQALPERRLSWRLPASALQGANRIDVTIAS